VSAVSFPDPGPDGEQPPPGVPAWDGTPACGGDDDFDMDAEMTRFLADIEAGRERIPDPWEEVPACAVSLGEAAGGDLAGLAAMAGPDGLGGEAFAKDKAADAMRPGPVLSALTEQAAGSLEALSDNQLLGTMSAARRLQNRAEYLELRATAEFTRRSAAAFEASRARKDPRGCRGCPGRQGAHRRRRDSAAQRRGGRQPAATAGAGLSGPDLRPRPHGPRRAHLHHQADCLRHVTK
jgi:hypothetical protein